MASTLTGRSVVVATLVKFCSDWGPTVGCLLWIETRMLLMRAEYWRTVIHG
jgi:hypothetical protein